MVDLSLVPFVLSASHVLFMYVCPTQFAHQMMCSRGLTVTRQVILTVKELIARPEHMDSTREYSWA